VLERSPPWPLPEKSFCEFYHSMDFPDGDSVTGIWDIRGRFAEYIGHYPLQDKTVLDVGTASGFLAFSAEAAGAKVTATDVKHPSQITLLPFKEHPYQSGDLVAWEAGVEEHWKHTRSAFWYAWHKHHSNVEMVYASLNELRYWDERFDVVIAGALLEHLGDPVSAIGTIARLAKEAVIIAFTPIEFTDELLMCPIADLANPANYWTWWKLSLGLYRQIFRNVGFEIEIIFAKARNVTADVDVNRPTIIARRMSPPSDLLAGKRGLLGCLRRVVRRLKRSWVGGGGRRSRRPAWHDRLRRRIRGCWRP